MSLASMHNTPLIVLTSRERSCVQYPPNVITQDTRITVFQARSGAERPFILIKSTEDAQVSYKSNNRLTQLHVKQRLRLQLYPGEPHGRDLIADPGDFVGFRMLSLALIFEISSSLASPTMEDKDTGGAKEADIA